MPQIYLQIKDLAALNPTVSLPASKQSWPEPEDSEKALNNFILQNVISWFTFIAHSINTSLF